MIHAGAIIGAIFSQGNRMFNFGFDASWTKFQDLRNDSTKRDFVTFGAAAGVAAAFKAPIGGILFTLEEGASFWSTDLTFKAFFCAMITQLVVSLMTSQQSFGRDDSEAMFAFGQFDNLDDGKTNYRVYELFIFIAMGAAGGVLGSLFNHINEQVSIFRIKHVNKFKWKRMAELLLITTLMAFIRFILSVCWVECTPLPVQSSDWTVQEVQMLGKLVPFQCGEGYYNQLSSLFLVSGDTAMRQLFHYREYNGTPYSTFDTGCLVLFVLPYFLVAAVTSGVMAPAGLFVPTLLSGAAFGRIIGHLLNCAFPGYVADSGTYALIGAAAILGGMARMTIAGTVICLEACGNMAYLLPLMLVFGASRYSGNAINEGMYDMQIHLKEIPFLEGSLHSLGLLNYHPISELMNTEVITLKEVDRVGRIYHLLKTTKHHGFPVVNEKGVLRGFVLRKALTTLLKLKAFSQPVPSADVDPNDLVQLAPAATVFYDTIERNYPEYPSIDEAKITKSEMVS
jgi:H+/Cl- antiporter ClcA